MRAEIVCASRSELVNVCRLSVMLSGRSPKRESVAGGARREASDAAFEIAAWVSIS